MEGEWFFEASQDRVAAVEAGEVWTVLAGAEVILANLGIIELAGEFPAVFDGFHAQTGDILTIWRIRIDVQKRIGGISYATDIAITVMEIIPAITDVVF